MFGKLLPQDTSFYDFFDQHAALTLQAAHCFQQFISVDQIPLQNGVNLIKDLEHQADAVTFHCVEALRRCFITPFQQDDIYRLISNMDDVIDAIDEAYEDCITYKILFPNPAAKEFALLIVAAVNKLKFLLNCLRNRRSHVKEILETCREIGILENEADILLRQAVGQLFDEEQDLRLLIKWKEIYEDLERAMDHCNDVANTVEGIMLEYD